MSGEQSDTPLARLLKDEIRQHGPISVSRYMQACLTHEEFGYYRSKQAIGSAGDFITAPEISQIFGEFAASERAQMTRAYFPNVRHQAVLRALELVVVPLAAALRVARHFTWDSVERGAERVLWCALDRRIPSGTYCNNFGDIDVPINPLALNVTLAKVVAQQALRAARVADF